jgi:hypothetical protein
MIFNPPAPLPLPQHDATMASTFNTVLTHQDIVNRPLAIIDHVSGDPPKTLLVQPDQNWNLGSTGKLGVAVGALALRKDVQNLRTAGAAASLAEADDIMRNVWSISDQAKVKRIGAANGYPIPSSVLEWDATGVFFQGERANVDFSKFDNLPDEWDPFITRIEQLTFWERMIFMLKASEGVSTRHIQGAVGIRYTNAALQALGLFDAKDRRGIRIGGAYAPSAASFMRMRQPKTDWDEFPQGKDYDGKNARASLHYCGTARTLAGLMNAVFQDAFMGFHTSFLFQDLTHSEAMTVDTDGLLGARAIRADAEGWCKVGIWHNRTDFTRVKYGDHQYGMVLLGYPRTTIGQKFGSLVQQAMESIHPP